MRRPSGSMSGDVPPELRDQLDGLLADEPEHPEPDVVFSRSDYDRRPLTLRRFLAPFKWALVGCVGLVIVETIAMRIGPLLTQLAIDHGMGLKDLGGGEVTGSRGVLVAICLTYLGFVVVAILVSRWRTLWTGIVGERLLYALRVRVFSHLQRLSQDFFSRQKKGTLISRMTNDIEHLQGLLHDGLAQLLVQALTLVVLGAQLFWFSAELALISFLVVIPVMVALTWWFRGVSQRGYLVVRDRMAEVLTHLSESLSGARVVAAHNRQQRNVADHVDVTRRYRHANYYTARIAAIYGPGSEAVGRLTVVVVLLLGGWMVLRGDMRVGELAGFLLAITTFFAPMQQMAQLYNAYQQGQAGITKLRQLLMTEVTVMEDPHAYPLPDIDGRVTLDRVSFGYDVDNPVLRNVSLEIPPGETLALVGPTGAGKSTIAKLVTRAYDPTSGRVLLDGHDLRDVRLDSLHQRMAVVPQEPFLFSMSLRDNIAFARPDAADVEVERTARAVGLGDFLDRSAAGIHAVVHERGASLSAGERQLVALARALLAAPRVLVLDEATSSLDLRTERQVERALDVVLTDRTAIIIAHRLSTAMRADRVAVVDDGRILEIGTHDELAAKGGRYAEMYATWDS
ncbi:ABC transporter ATP-binding protein [Haloechinothrix salitolerans]|uniref:ABC transporter ATP-binding protein n=1 Tax=Haloechinothrix salitolerans TaxID=926830 RepID=A0ABW2C9K6_9PSEU